MALVLHDVKLSRPNSELLYTLHVPPGSCLAIMGPSGSGKSSLLNLISGFESPQSGTIYFNHISLRPLDPGERPLSILFQQGNLFEHLSIRDNMALGLRGTLRLSQSEAKNVQDALASVGLETLSHKKPVDLSGGEQQRAALARCILQQKPLLLLDEPFNALDPQNRWEMLSLVKKLHAKLKLLTMIVTHDPQEALGIADLAAFIYEGRVLAVNTPHMLLQNPHPTIQAFCQAHHLLEQAGKMGHPERGAQ